MSAVDPRRNRQPIDAQPQPGGHTVRLGESLAGLPGEALPDRSAGFRPGVVSATAW